MSEGISSWPARPLDRNSKGMLNYFIRTRRSLIRHLERWIQEQESEAESKIISSKSLTEEMNRYFSEFYIYSTVEREVYRDIPSLLAKGTRPNPSQFYLPARRNWRRLEYPTELTYIEEKSLKRPESTKRALEIERLEKEILEEGRFRFRWGSIVLEEGFLPYIQEVLGTEPFFLENLDGLRIAREKDTWRVTLFASK